jgi:hypothetical protein
MSSILTLLFRSRRALGALVLVCLSMITAAPLAAITVGGECERKCCVRVAKKSHACCKRNQSPASELEFSGACKRCAPGQANASFVRLKPAAVVSPVLSLAQNLRPVAAAVPVVHPLYRSTPTTPPLFQRPPPAL